MATADHDGEHDDVRRYLAERRNWGRWGEDDEVGAVNLITPERRIAAARLVTEGRSISLSRPFAAGQLGGTGVRSEHVIEPRIDRGDGGGAITDYYGTSYHGAGSTHIDAISHVWDGDGMYGGRNPDDVISDRGVDFCDIDQWRDGIVTRGVLLDVPAHRGADYVDVDQPVQGAELEEILAGAGVTMHPGDAVLVYCGREAWVRRYGDYGVQTRQVTNGNEADPRPGLHGSCLTFIRDHDVSMLVSDMIDAYPTGYDDVAWTVHGALWAFGTALLDNALLEPLAEHCRRTRRVDFMLTVAPLRVPGGTGSPVNPLAIL